MKNNNDNNGYSWYNNRYPLFTGKKCGYYPAGQRMSMPSTHTGNMVTAVTPPIKMVITGGWFAFMALFYPHSKGYMHDINPFHSIPLESIFSKSISMLRPHTLVILPLFQLNQENPT